MAIGFRSSPISGSYQFVTFHPHRPADIRCHADSLAMLVHPREFSRRGFQVVGKDILGIRDKSDELINPLPTVASRKFLPNPNDSGKRRGPICMAFVEAGNDQALFCLLLSCAAVAQVMERRTKWGTYLSSPLLAMGGGMILSHLGIIPKAAPIYGIIFSHIMPLAMALCLLETNVQQAFVKAGTTLKAFGLGAIATIMGTLISFRMVGHLLGQDGWKIASCLCSSYIGGGINYAATAKALGLTSGSILAAGMAADNLVMAIYFGLIMSIPAEQNEDGPKIDSHNGSNYPDDYLNPTVETMAISLFAATTACSIGNSISAVLPSCFAGSSLGLMALVASAISYVAARLSDVTSRASVPVFAGSQILGGSLMLVFFSVVGATCGIREAIFGGWYLLIFIVLLVGIHLALILFLGRCCGIPRCMILVASNANIGGPATAAAMATARNWPGLVQPAIFVGTIGYTIGTAVGCAIGAFLLKHIW